MRNQIRIVVAFALSLTFTLISGAISSPANAVGEIDVYAPATNAVYVGSTIFNSQTNDYSSLVVNSRTIKLTLESDVSVTRIISTNLGTGLRSISFNPLAPDSTLLSNSSIVSVNSSLGSSAAYPAGIYKVTFSWQYELSGIQTKTNDVLGVTFKHACEPGTFSSDGGVPLTGSFLACDLAVPGKFVATSGQTTSTDCPVGKYAFNSGSIECDEARPGRYVDETASIQDILCPANTYQNLSGQSSCIPCPTNYTSSIGSDALADCIAPAVSGTPSTPTVVEVVSPTVALVATPTVAKGKKLSSKSLAKQIGISIPKKAKVTLKVAKASKKNCKVSGTSIKALKPGTCLVTVKVNPKKGKTTTKSTTIVIS